MNKTPKVVLPSTGAKLVDRPVHAIRRACASGDLPAEKRGAAANSRWHIQTRDLIAWDERTPR